MEIGTNFRAELPRLDKDLELLHRAGFECVRAGTMKIQHRGEGFTFENLDQVIQPLVRDGYDIIFGMDVRHFSNMTDFPDTLDDPEKMLTDQEGRSLFQQGFRNFNFNHPGLREAWARYIDAFCSYLETLPPAQEGERRIINFCNELHYKARSSIVARKPEPGETYDYDREKVHHGFTRLRSFFHPERGFVGDFDTDLHITDYSSYTIEKFRRWLRQRYSSVEELNRAWECSFDDFGAVDPPRGRPFGEAGAHPAWMEWMRFRYDDLQEVFEWVRNHNHSGCGLTHNFVAARYLLSDPFCGVDLWRMAETLDPMGIDYPDIFDFYLLSSTGRPVEVIEHGVGYHEDYMFRETLLSAAGGARGIYYWQTTMDYLEERADAFRGVEKARPFARRMTGTMVPPRVATLFSHPSAFALVPEEASRNIEQNEQDAGGEEDVLARLTRVFGAGEARFYSSEDYFGHVLAAWMGLMETGYAAHTIGASFLEGDDLDVYDVLVLPKTVALSPEHVTTLQGFDGTLVATGSGWGQWDHLRKPARDSRIGTLFGCRRLETRCKPATVTFRGRTFQVDSYDVLQPDEGEPVARTDAGEVVGVVSERGLLLGFDLFVPARFGKYDNLEREILEYGAFRRENTQAALALADELEARGIKPDVARQAATPGSMAHDGVWHSFLQDGDRLQVVFYNYRNWFDVWKTQFDWDKVEWDGVHTQPRCVRPKAPYTRQIFRPEPQSFDVTVQLPPGFCRERVRGFKDTDLEFLELESVACRQDESGAVQVRIDDLEFIYVLEFDRSAQG